MNAWKGVKLNQNVAARAAVARSVQEDDQRTRGIQLPDANEQSRRSSRVESK